MIVPTGYVGTAQIAEAVESARQLLGPEVVRLRHSVGPDSFGEPALHFRVVLDAGAFTRETLGRVARKVEETLITTLRPIENWGLFPFFSFRSSAELSTEREWL